MSNGIIQACPPWEKGVRMRVGFDTLRFASWNIRTLTSKSIELVKASCRRKINIASIQEVKWVGIKGREINGYNLWYLGRTRARNRVGIMVGKELVDQVVEVTRKSEHLMLH